MAGKEKDASENSKKEVTKSEEVKTKIIKKSKRDLKKTDMKNLPSPTIQTYSLNEIGDKGKSKNGEQ